MAAALRPIDIMTVCGAVTTVAGVAFYAGERHEFGLAATVAAGAILAMIALFRRANHRAGSGAAPDSSPAHRLAATPQEAVDTLLDGFILYYADDRVALTNAKYRELHAINEIAAVPGTRFEDLFRAAIACGEIPVEGTDVESVVRERLALHRNPSGTFERRLGERWVQITEHRTASGGIVGIHTDITELRRAAVALEAARARMADFAGTASDWFWESDVDGKLTYLSEPFEEATGVSVASRIGAVRLDINRQLDPENPHWDEHLETVAARQPFRDFVMTVRFPRGAKHLSISAKAILGPDGDFLGYRGTTRDVTRRVEAQRILHQQKEELAATAAKLATASAAKSMFLANMSHELRTPLNAIMGFSEITRDAKIGPIDAKYREYAHDIHDAGQHLLRLINDVLDISKMEAGQMALTEEFVMLDEVIGECQRLVKDRAEARNVDLVVDLPAESPALFADRLRIKQTLLNVLSNAVKFTDPGGQVSVSVAGPSSDGVAVVVADTGIGMKPAEIPLALEPFRQIDGSFVRRYEGTGLGLPLAKNFVELHGGRLEIESEPGKGTTVRICLPQDRLVANRQLVSR